MMILNIIWFDCVINKTLGQKEKTKNNLLRIQAATVQYPELSPKEAALAEDSPKVIPDMLCIGGEAMKLPLMAPPAICGPYM